MTLTEFLLARIAEDEAAVNERTRWMAPRGSELLEHFGDFGEDERWMIEIPAGRLLAECEAKRRIIADHRIDVDWCVMCKWQDDRGCPTLRHLAAVYADHPDFRDEWKP